MEPIKAATSIKFITYCDNDEKRKEDDFYKEDHKRLRYRFRLPW